MTSGNYFEVGNILLARITPSFENGKQGILESLPVSFGVGSTELIPIQALPGVSHCDFLFFYLLHSDVRAELASKMEGTTGRQRLSKSTLERYPIILPPLPEQRAIAATLRAVQEARDARRRELAAERERKAALMEALFTDGLRGEAQKETEIGPLPQGWQCVTLRELCNDGKGAIQTGPFGSQLHASAYTREGIPMVNPTHLGLNTIRDTDIPRISSEDANRLSRHSLRVGDILISRRGDFSRYSYISPRHKGWMCGTGCLLNSLEESQSQ